MKKWILCFILIVFSVSIVLSWGFFAHKRVNRLAVFTLPSELIGFYKNNIDWITEHAVDADKRRYASPDEAPRHFLDADYYGENPFDSIPKRWNDAVAKYTEDTLLAYGIIPWHIDRVTRQLTQAFKDKNALRILRLSADLGHYVGDAHVPLHTTLNYNGQLTNQIGIHGFWETRLPELFYKDYNYFVGKAIYLDDPLETAWQIVKESFAALDSVLLFEAQLTKEFPSDRKYSVVLRNGRAQRDYSVEFTTEYHKRLNGMVERRMRSSIRMVGSFWYTAWVNAGKPDLRRITKNALTAEEIKQIEEEEKLYQQGKILGRPEEH